MKTGIAPDEFLRMQKRGENGFATETEKGVRLDGLVRTGISEKTERLAFSPGNTCRTWLYLPIKFISSIDERGTTTCNGQTYQQVSIFLKGSPRNMSDWLPDLLNELGDGLGGGDIREVPITEVRARGAGHLLDREWLMAPEVTVWAQWQGMNNPVMKSRGLFTPAGGMFIVQVEIEVLSSNNGWHEAQVVGGGMNFISQTDLKHVYDEAIKFAGEVKQDMALKAALEQKFTQHLGMLTSIQSSHNTLEYVAIAQGHCGVFGRCRGHHKIRPKVEVARVGANVPDVVAALEAQYQIDIPNV